MEKQGQRGRGGRVTFAEAVEPAQAGQPPKVTPNMSVLCRTSGGRARTTLSMPWGQLTLARCRVIRKDPTVKLCLKFMAMPLKRMQFVVIGEEQEQIDFVQKRVLPVIPAYMEQAALSRDFGYNAMETRYIVDTTDGRIILKSFKVLDLERVAIIEDEAGSLLCLEYQNVDGTKSKLLALEGKFLLVTNRPSETPNRLGISELEEAQEWFYRKRLTADMAARWTEKKADPARIIEYLAKAILTESTPGTVTAQKAATIALDYGKKLRQGANAAVPCNEAGEPYYRVKEEQTSDRSPVFRGLIDMWNTEIMHALMVPERALTQAQQVGSYSMAETHAEFFVQAQEDAASSFLEPFNEHILTKLLAFNFAAPDMTLKIGHAGLRGRDKEIMLAVLKVLLDLVQKGKPLGEDVVKKISEMSGLPLEAESFELPEAPEPESEDEDKGKKPGEEEDEDQPADEDEELELHEHRVPLLRMLSEARPGLARSLTEREQEYGERYFLSFESDWQDIERELVRDLMEVIGRQRSAFKQSLSQAMSLGTNKQKFDAVKQFGLRMQSQYETALREGMTKAAFLGKRQIWKELGLTRGGGSLTGESSSFCRTQAGLSADADLGKLLTNLRNTSVRSIQQSLHEKDVLFRIDKVFDKFLEDSLGSIVIVDCALALNQGRREIEAAGLTGEEELVSATRVSVMEPGSTCEVCAFYDGMTWELNDPVFDSVVPPSGCLGGGHCWCIMLYNQRKMRPGIREANSEPLPKRLADKVWF